METNDIVIALGALAQESRLAIFRALVRRGPQGYTPGDLVDRISIPAPTLSFHLKELQRAGLVASRRDGRFLHYSVNFGAMQDLIEFLTENCCSLSDVECVPAPTVKRKRA